MSPASHLPGVGGTTHRDNPRRPSPPWYGGIAALLFFASYGWILAYAFGPAPGLGSLGSWNYAVAACLFITSVVIIRFWRAG